MNPEAAEAVPKLVERGVLTPEKGALLLRIARDELVSVHTELRALLYVGVTAIMAGVALLVKQNLDRIGPVTIAVTLGLAALACLAWVVRTAPAFSWQEAPSPHLAFDYVQLLGALLTAADLAYVEVKFTPLGADWPWQLLGVALFYASLAFRYDSRLLFSLSLSTFAAWRGVSATSFVRFSWLETRASDLRLEALVCGGIFLMLGWAMLRGERKAHFEPVASHLGWLLVLGALGSGALAESRVERLWPVYAALLLIVGAGLAFASFKRSRPALLSFGVVAAYAGASRIAVEALHISELIAAWFVFTAIIVIVVLVSLIGRIQEGR